MPVIFPAGTFKVTSTLNWKIPNLVVQGAGPGNTIISMAGSRLNIPILELAGTTLDIGGFTLEYASQPASGNTSAAAIAIGDNTVGALFGSRLHEINIFNVNTGMTIVSTTVGGCSSNTFENIEINGFTYSALNMQAASGTGGGDCTGNHWSNIYVHNNPLGSRTAAAGIAVHFKSFDENVFNQFNVEHGNHYLHDVLQFELCGNTIINSLHFEDLDMAGSGSPNIAFISQISGGSTIINGLTIRSPILTGSVANPVVRFNSAAGNVTVNGYNEVIGSGGISTAHPYCDFGSEAGCTMVVTSVAASLTTALEIQRRRDIIALRRPADRVRDVPVPAVRLRPRLADDDGGEHHHPGRVRLRRDLHQRVHRPGVRQRDGDPALPHAAERRRRRGAAGPGRDGHRHARDRQYGGISN